MLEGNPETSYNAQRDYETYGATCCAREPPPRERCPVDLVVSSAHPGISATNLVTSPDGIDLEPVVRRVMPYVLPIIFQSSAAGANPSLWAATYGEPGGYVGPTRFPRGTWPAGQRRSATPARAQRQPRPAAVDDLRAEDGHGLTSEVA